MPAGEKWKPLMRPCVIRELSRPNEALTYLGYARSPTGRRPRPPPRRHGTNTREPLTGNSYNARLHTRVARRRYGASVYVHPSFFRSSPPLQRRVLITLRARARLEMDSRAGDAGTGLQKLSGGSECDGDVSKERRYTSE